MGTHGNLICRYRSGAFRPGSFDVHETVACTYLSVDLDGRSPKFKCRIGGADDVK
jgi:hypothetical protein